MRCKARVVGHWQIRRLQKAQEAQGETSHVRRTRAVHNSRINTQSQRSHRQLDNHRTVYASTLAFAVLHLWQIREHL